MNGHDGHGRVPARVETDPVSVSIAHEDDHAIATVTAGGNAVEQTCHVPLLDEGDLPGDDRSTSLIRYAVRKEREAYGRPRNLTRAVMASTAAWQTTTRALHLYETLRRIDRPVVDVLCLYTSLLNGCRYCIDDAAGEALGHGWSRESLLELGGDHASVFPPDLTAALRFARTLTLDPALVDEELMSDVRRHFDDEAVLELAAVVGMKTFWNRFATALRIPPEGKCGDTGLVRELEAVSASLRRVREDGADDGR